MGGVLVAALLVVHFLTAGPVEPSGVVLGTSVAVPPARVQVGASPESARSTASPSAPQATAQSNTTSLPGGERLRVTGTDGQGVVLRASPRDDDRTPRGLLEGSQVTVLERREPDWARVRADNGQEGWVPARYLTR